MTVETASLPLVRVPGVVDALAQESRLRRVVLFAAACLLAVSFFFVAMRFWLPVHPGVDQNGYLVGGKLISANGSMAFTPRGVADGAIDPFQFVGRMWVGFDLGTPDERYYPKYPVGLPLIYAGALQLGGENHGLTLVYLVSPLLISLSFIAVHLLSRLLLGSIAAFTITLLVATSPVALSCTNNPNSHATTLFLVAWGMYLLVRWWLHGGLWAAVLAGLLVGSAVSIRYSEGLLVLPLALVALFRIAQLGWRNRRAWMESAALAVGWLAPVAALAWHNRAAMGTWTGYDPTNESTGFAWKYFVENWDTMLRLMYQTGMTLLFPMAVAGLAAGFIWNWRIAAFLAAWAVPSLLLYTAYYWAPEGLNIGYTRFFLSIFPALAICAFGLLLWPASHLPTADEAIRQRLKRGAAMALAVITLVSVPLGITNIQQSILGDRAGRRNLQARASAVLDHAPKRSVLFCEDSGLIHHIQMAGDYLLYSPEVFLKSTLDRLVDRSNPDEPGTLDAARTRYLATLATQKSQTDMDTMREQLIADALKAGRRVFVFTLSGSGTGRGGMFRMAGWRGLSTSKFAVRTVVNGTDPEALPRDTPLARFGLAAPGRDRSPTTLPRAQWQLLEVTLKQ